ncbi:hypothetical protein HOLleu_18745 [Holothuria leucospilota]|uniref:RNA-directed DNA polymerase n=1 Tax=Holothuria leucospilota TaxID=206669 RepID=A0A9Q1H6X4_HOLLE|nr:hypothetical protein HOLleu_18745 [Holothuria leucospilota]
MTRRYRSPSPRRRKASPRGGETYRYQDRYDRCEDPLRKSNDSKYYPPRSRKTHEKLQEEFSGEYAPPDEDKPLPYIRVLLENTPVDAFIDTGSDLTIMSEQLRNHIPSLIRQAYQPPYFLAKSVTGENIDSVGTVRATLSIGSQLCKNDFHVVRNVSRPLLLGWDFLLHNQATVDVREGVLVIGDDKLPLLRKRHDAPASCNLITVEHTIIPPESYVQIRAMLETSPYIISPDSYVGILEPKYFDEPAILVPRTISKIHDGHLLATIVNPTKTSVQVKKDSLLGQVYSIHGSKDPEYVILDEEYIPKEMSKDTGKIPKVNVDLEHLTQEQRDKVNGLLREFSDVFQDFPGRTDLVRHAIRTKSDPISQRAYRTSPKMKVEIQAQIDKLLKDDIIEESQSPWSAPIVLVKKKDNTYRFCVDYRKLNAVTIRDSHPLPRVDDILDAIAGSQYFSTMDLTHGYWQIMMNDNDKEKTAFTTGIGLYQFRVMPMGLVNAPSSFQRLMGLVLKATGAVLCQKQSGKEVVIAYASHTFTKPEQNWATYDKELFAIVWAVRNFRQYLSSSKFIIYTDHKPLVGLHKIPIGNDPTGRRARWALEMDLYDWVIKYRPGCKNGNADALSRIPSPLTGTASQCTTGSHNECNDVLVNSVLPENGTIQMHDGSEVHSSSSKGYHSVISNSKSAMFLGIDNTVIRQEQTSDPILSEVIEWVTHGKKPPKQELTGTSRVLRKLWWEFPKLVIVEGLLCRKLLLPGRESLQLVILKAMIDEILPLIHGSGYAGHFGCDKTLRRAQQNCYWPYMQQSIREYCLACESCNVRNSPIPQRKAPMQSIRTSRPFQVVCADITELPVTAKGNRYVLVLMDHFSKYVNLYPMQDQKAVTVAKCIFENYVKQHGIPEQLHTDQGRQFEGEVVTHLCKSLGIRKTRTTPYHPQSDGLIERFNRTMKDQLAKYIAAGHSDWDDEYLGYIEFAYNTACHSTTGYTPYFVLHGRECRTPVTLLTAPPELQTNVTPGTPAFYCTKLKEKMKHAFESITEQSAGSQEKQKYYYDLSKKFHPFLPGDLVMVNNAADRSKIAPKWVGPFLVVKVLSRSGDNITYEIQDNANPARLFNVHYNRLKPYYEKPTNLNVRNSGPLIIPERPHRKEESRTKNDTPVPTSMKDTSYKTTSGRTVKPVKKFGNWLYKY